MPNLEEIGVQAKERRNALGLTQAEAAHKSCISRSAVSKIEKGKFTGSVTAVIWYLHTVGLLLTATPRIRPTLETLDATLAERRLK